MLQSRYAEEYARQLHEERLERSEVRRRTAVLIKQERARDALKRAIEESLRSGFPIEEVRREVFLSLDRTPSR